MMLRTKGEQKAFLDGFESCADCIEKYLSAEGKKQLDCLISGVRSAVEIEDISALSEEDNTMEWKAIYDRTEIGSSFIAHLCGFECSKCNKQVDHMYDFCPHCGRKRVSE